MYGYMTLIYHIVGDVCGNEVQQYMLTTILYFYVEATFL